MTNQSLTKEELQELYDKTNDLYRRFVQNRWDYLKEAWKDESQEFIEDNFRDYDFSTLSTLQQLSFLEYLSQKLLDEKKNAS